MEKKHLEISPVGKIMEECARSTSLYDIVRSKKWVEYSTAGSIENAKTLIRKVDADTDVVLMTVHGGISSPDIVAAFATMSPISELVISSLTVGYPAMEMLGMLNDLGKLDKVIFFLSEVMRQGNFNDNDSFKKKFVQICESKGWESNEINNHSKMILITLEDGRKFTIETSANFNKNPKMEQFRISADADLFTFYHRIFDEIRVKTTRSTIRRLDSYDCKSVKDLEMKSLSIDEI